MGTEAVEATKETSPDGPVVAARTTAAEGHGPDPYRRPLASAAANGADGHLSATRNHPPLATGESTRIQPAPIRRSPTADATPTAVPTSRIQPLTHGGDVIRRQFGTVPAPYKTLGATPRAMKEAPKSLAELARNAELSHRLWATNQDVLLDILLGPFEANWFKAKACLTMEQWPDGCKPGPPHDVGISLMQALVVIREAKWKAFVADVVKPEFAERMAMFGKVTEPLVDIRKLGTTDSTSHPLDPEAMKGDVDLQSDLDAHAKEQRKLQEIFPSVGADAVTSDVDLASGGSNSELGVQFVNSRFRTHFRRGIVIPYDPGTVFDINVYASDWIHDQTPVDNDGARTITPQPEVAGMSAGDQLSRTKKMEVWSLVKVRRNMTGDEWKTYSAATLAGLTEVNARADMQAKLLSADTEHTKFRRKVEQRQVAMLASLTAQEQKFFGNRDSPFGKHDHYAEDAKFTRAANAIYEDTLQEVKQIRLRIEKRLAEPVKDDVAISNLGVLLADKIAEALTYANEVYATEGAVQHTVLKQGAGKTLAKLQAKKGTEHLTSLAYDLKPELYLQSVNENIGDSLHSIEHYKDVPRYAVYRAGKYLSRLCDATTLLLGAKKNLVPGYLEIQTIGSESVRVKSIKVGAIEGDPKFVDDDAFFKKYGAGDLNAVRSQIIAFGAEIPKLMAQKQADERAAKQAAEQQAAAQRVLPASEPK